MRAALHKLETLKFDNRSLRALPIDPITENYVRARVPNACFSLVKPAPLLSPTVVCASPSALEMLGLDPKEATRSDFAEFMSGNKLLPGMQPAAHCYCGHQFGYFSGQLGDGAAMYLGEIVTETGDRHEIQLKGAGKTPYSRHADGRKVLRSSLREFLCSEAQHFLNIPTTRAVCVVTSDSLVERDIHYNNNPIMEHCSVVMRVAPTFLRFGSFEIFKHEDRVTQAAGPSAGNKQLAKTMLNFMCDSYFPSISPKEGSNAAEADLEKWSAVFREITSRTARLVAQWQSVGFCHGVLNTDNMSVMGITLDYGPFGWMEFYDPGFVCNSSDHAGRYSFEAQPEVCRWNCEKFGEAISDVLPREYWEPHLAVFDEVFVQTYNNLMKQKLGLSLDPQPNDMELVEKLLDAMAKTRADFTRTFRALSDAQMLERISKVTSNDEAASLAREFFLPLCAPVSVCVRMLTNKLSQIQPQLPMPMLRAMRQSSGTDPRFAMLEPGVRQQLQLEFQKLDRIDALQKEIAEFASEEEVSLHNTEAWATWLQEYGARLREQGELCVEKMAAQMRAANPRVVLRNSVAQKAIQDAERGDFSTARRLLEVLSRPFDDHEHAHHFEGELSADSINICVSCSS